MSKRSFSDSSGKESTGLFSRKKKKVSKDQLQNDTSKRLIVVLECAFLETVSLRKGEYELLNCDDHQRVMKKHKRDFATARPDIVHQCLLMLFDSALNKAGLLQVYIHTQKNVCIYIDPQTRIPRTFKRFCGLMVQLLHEFKIQAKVGTGEKNSGEESLKRITLLQIVKNPFTQYIPVGCKIIGTSKTGKAVDIQEYVKEVTPQDKPIAFIIGAMSHGKISSEYTEDYISMSEYPLSGAMACAKVCIAMEKLWGIR